MAMKTTTLAGGSVALLEPKGSLIGGDETDELRAAVTDLFEQGNRKLVIDLSKVTYLNSTAIGVLVQAHTSYSKNGGTVKNSAGLTGAKNAWGKTAEWCDYSGPLSNRLVGITVMSDPKNFRPSWFHCRDYGLVVANPFGRKAFTKGEPSSVLVEKGEIRIIRFGAFIHSSPTNQPPDLNAVYKLFADQR